MSKSKNEVEVLCCLGERRRPVKYTAEDGKSTLECLHEAVKETFQDVLPSSTKMFLQLKNEKWAGEFVDIKDMDSIPNQSVIRAVVEKSEVRNLCIQVTWTNINNLTLCAIRTVLDSNELVISAIS